MRNSVLLALSLFALLSLVPAIQAAPEAKDNEHRRTQIAALAKDKGTRLMMIHQLMSTAEGKRELADALKRDAEFRSYYDAHGVNPG